MNSTEAIDMEEEKRIKAVKKYNILDTPPDGSFDRITKLAAKLLNVPIAIVSIVDTDRIWFKSRYGLEAQQIERYPGLCASAILSDEMYLVEDAIKDVRTLANPLVAGEFGLRFYAAVPLKVKDGYNLGTLCVIDKKARELTISEKEILQYLADILIDQLELRLAARTANYHQNQLLNIAAHDLKNPLSTILLLAEIIKEEKTDPEAIEEMCEQIKKSVMKMTRLINDMLESARKEASRIQLHTSKLDFASLIERIVTTNRILATNKNQQLYLHIQNHPLVCADENKLTEIADNLINNAIKYSPQHKNITVIVKEKNNKAILEVQDEGPGLTEVDKENMFQHFTRLSAKPTNGESSTGLGLSIVKLLVEAHNGTVYAESEGENKGSKFIVELPAVN
ncbi:MAG: GAF domain-containing sensor histidine kinase [Chitinophagaceae bacterium]